MHKLTCVEKFTIDTEIKKRKEAGYSQLELADKIDLSPVFIGKIKSTKFPSKYNLNHINKLAKVFNCMSPEGFPA